MKRRISVNFLHRTLATSSKKPIPPTQFNAPVNKLQQQEGNELLSKYTIPPPIRNQNETIERQRSRLTWMSRKRGILETDLILSTFAQKYLSTYTKKELDEYDDLLAIDDWSIYYYVTKAKPLPKELLSSKIMGALIEHAKNTEKKILRVPDVC